MNRLILGVGTGRCGTKSLTRLLGYQPNTLAKHERYKSKVRWKCPNNLWPLRLWKNTDREENDISASVDFKWTGHLDYFLEKADNSEREIRVIGLKRDRQEVIESYDKWKPNSDHWSFHGYRETKPDEWDKCYPVYNTESKREGIGLFWDEVYEILEGYEDERVKVFRTKDLNKESGVRSILKHAGYSNPNVQVGIKVNAPQMDKAQI